MRTIVIIVILITGGRIATAESQRNSIEVDSPVADSLFHPSPYGPADGDQQFYHPYAEVLQQLLELGASPAFVSALQYRPEVEFDEKFTRINIIGLSKKPDYSVFYQPEAVQKCVEFVLQHDSLLLSVAQSYQVPAEIIVAILYVETKLGQYTGRHHVPSVFISVAMADQPEYVEKNRQRLRQQFQGSAEELYRLEQRLEKRSRQKARWALKELLALDQLYTRYGVDVFNLYGSWAGAFGLSQFLPSSVLQWGVDGDRNGRIDLFTLPDAVHSIANYLKHHGWDSTLERQKQALYAYNRSVEYGDAVLRLAQKIRQAVRNKEYR